MIIRYVILFSSILAGALGQIFFKTGINNFNNGHFYLYLAKNPWVYLGAASYGISFILWMQVLHYFELSYARPFTSVGYIVTVFLAVMFLDESLSWQKLFGVMLIVIGVFLIK